MQVQIKNIRQQSLSEVNQELQKGARFKVFPYRIGLIVHGVYRLSPAILVRNKREQRKFAFRYILKSLLMGIWYFPYGPFDVRKEIKRCRQGGLDVTNDIIAGLDEDAIMTGSVDVRKNSLQFKRLAMAELDLVNDAIDPILAKYPEITQLYIGTFVNTGHENPPHYYLGHNRCEDGEIFRYEIRKAICQALGDTIAEQSIFIHLRGDETSYQLLMQGDCLRDRLDEIPQRPSGSSRPAGLEEGSAHH